MSVSQNKPRHRSHSWGVAGWIRRPKEAISTLCTLLPPRGRFIKLWLAFTRLNFPSWGFASLPLLLPLLFS